MKWCFNHTWFSRFDNIILNFYASNALFDKYIKVLDVKHCVALFSIIIIVTSSLHQWIKNQIRSKSDMCLKKRNWQVALFWNYTKRLHTVFCINMLRLFVPVKIISNRTLSSSNIVRMNTKKRFRFSFYPCITFSLFHPCVRVYMCLSLLLMYAFISLRVSTFSCYWYNICPEKRKFYFFFYRTMK